MKKKKLWTPDFKKEVKTTMNLFGGATTFNKHGRLITSGCMFFLVFFTLYLVRPLNYQTKRRPEILKMALVSATFSAAVYLFFES